MVCVLEQPRLKHKTVFFSHSLKKFQYAKWGRGEENKYRIRTACDRHLTPPPPLLSPPPPFPFSSRTRWQRERGGGCRRVPRRYRFRIFYASLDYPVVRESLGRRKQKGWKKKVVTYAKLVWVSPWLMAPRFPPSFSSLLQLHARFFFVVVFYTTTPIYVKFSFLFFLCRNSFENCTHITHRYTQQTSPENWNMCFTCSVCVCVCCSHLEFIPHAHKMGLTILKKKMIENRKTKIRFRGRASTTPIEQQKRNFNPNTWTFFPPSSPSYNVELTGTREPQTTLVGQLWQFGSHLLFIQKSTRAKKSVALHISPCLKRASLLIHFLFTLLFFLGGTRVIKSSLLPPSLSLPPFLPSFLPAKESSSSHTKKHSGSIEKGDCCHPPSLLFGEISSFPSPSDRSNVGGEKEREREKEKERKIFYGKRRANNDGRNVRHSLTHS